MLIDMIAGRDGSRYRVAGCETPSDLAAAGRSLSKAVLIADVETVGGPHRIADIVQAAPRLIATSAAGSLNVAVAAVKAGAIDFLPKPIGAKALIAGLETAVASWQTERRNTPGPNETKVETNATDFAGFVGQSAVMQAIYGQIQRMAGSRAPVFITGESGTGKELCAAAIHAEAGLGHRPFVAINCSAIPAELIESEIFGHVRGAFTGASDDRAGAAELADGGTLFLDEIAEMHLPLQAKLLRFVQTGRFRRVGGTDEKQVDVRVVSATNRNPQDEVDAGRFRADLFYRLHVLPIHLPPLRDRRGDILALAERFLRRFAEEEGRSFRDFHPAAAATLEACPWPGNVRQLENVIRQVVVLHDGGLVTTDMLPDSLLDVAVPMAEADGPILPFREQERRIIETALAAFDCNIQRAAAALQINPSTIYRKRQAWLEQDVA